jgi:hypothetical protein
MGPMVRGYYFERLNCCLALDPSAPLATVSMRSGPGGWLFWVLKGAEFDD